MQCQIPLETSLVPRPRDPIIKSPKPFPFIFTTTIYVLSAHGVLSAHPFFDQKLCGRVFINIVPVFLALPACLALGCSAALCLWSHMQSLSSYSLASLAVAVPLLCACDCICVVCLAWPAGIELHDKESSVAFSRSISVKLGGGGGGPSC